MNCEKMFEKMPLIINLSLNKKEESEALNHLMKCDVCRRELAFWTKIADTQSAYEKELSIPKKARIFKSLTQKPQTALGATKKAVKVYFKVIESILNI